MSGTHSKPALASYQDSVADMMENGTPFGDVEDAINAQPGLTEEQRAALWLFAFSLRDRSAQQSDVQAHLTAVQAGAGDNERASAERYRGAFEHARPLEFDDRGFPVPQRSRSFRDRMARYLNPQ